MDKDSGAPDGSVRPVILSGGGGTRLWPVSRTASPKQFLSLVEQQSMLQATAARCRFPMFKPLVVVSGEEQRFFILDQLNGLGADLEAVLLEPVPRNTAPAIALAARWLLERGEDEPMLVMPSDHLIGDVAAFQAAVARALPCALEGGLVTFGVEPSAPKTGYGYIKGAAAKDGEAARRVERFIEKPGQDAAEELVRSGDHFWNSGIFLFRPSAYLDELRRLAPELARFAEDAVGGQSADGAFIRPEPSAFAAMENISIDYAVMERTDRAFVVPVDLGWSDVGSWDAVREVLPKDGDGNVLRGDVVTLDVRNSIVRSDHDLTVAVVGMSDIICVVTRDAAFIAPLDRAQETKAVVERLRSNGHARADQPAQVFRPWGSYETMDRGDRFQTKRLIVNPGARLSLQKHHHRSEHWVVVAGTAEVTVGDKVMLLQENESTYIPAGTAHRLANPGKVPLHLVEVQCGPYLGEDDIVRLDDAYGRN